MACIVCGAIEHEVICTPCLTSSFLRKKRSADANTNRRDSFLYYIACSCGNARWVSYSSAVKHRKRVAAHGDITCNKCCAHGVKKGEGDRGNAEVDMTPIDIDGGCVIANAYEFKPKPGEDPLLAMSARCGESDLTCKKYSECCSAAAKRAWLGFINTSEKRRVPLLKGELERLVSLEIDDNDRLYDIIEAIIKKDYRHKKTVKVE